MAAINRTPINAANVDLITKGIAGTLADAIDVLSAYNVLPMEKYNTKTAVTTATLSAADISGGIDEVTLNMTGTLTAGVALTLPTVAALVTAIGNVEVGKTYKLNILNGGAGAFAWTVTQNTQGNFYETFTSLTAAVLQSLGVVGVTGV